MNEGQSAKIALFPGSFDPFTKGHEDIVIRALKIFDKVIVAIGDNHSKQNLFDIDRRKDWISRCFADNSRVEVVTYEGLTVDFCRKMNVGFLVRGLRNSTDFLYESDIAEANRLIDASIETIFIPCSSNLGVVSSSLVRELLHHHHDVSQFLPEAIRNDFARN